MERDLSKAVRAASFPTARTFQPRRRKLGRTRQASYERLRTVHGLQVAGPPLHGFHGAVLDIGFGYGAALVELARADRTQRVIGVEVHTPGIASVLDAIEADRLDHVHLVEGDVLEFLPRIVPGSLAAIRIWFPDPWPKARQQRRRIVRPDVVAALVPLLRPAGVLHLATDIDDYAVQMQRVCDAHPGLVGGRVGRPEWRPITGYERRGLAAGRQPVDLVYRRG